MKYWLYLVAKLAAALGVAWGLQVCLGRFYPTPEPLPARFGPPPPLFLHDMPFTICVMAIWLLT